MVNSLTKLGMAQGGSNLENRSLAIDLCGVMVLWEERCMQELKAGSGQVCGCHQNLLPSAKLASHPQVYCYERNSSMYALFLYSAELTRMCWSEGRYLWLCRRW